MSGWVIPITGAVSLVLLSIATKICNKYTKKAVLNYKPLWGYVVPEMFLYVLSFTPVFVASIISGVSFPILGFSIFLCLTALGAALLTKRCLIKHLGITWGQYRQKMVAIKELRKKRDELSYEIDDIETRPMGMPDADYVYLAELRGRRAGIDLAIGEITKN